MSAARCANISNLLPTRPLPLHRQPDRIYRAGLTRRCGQIHQLRRDPLDPNSLVGGLFFLDPGFSRGLPLVSPLLFQSALPRLFPTVVLLLSPSAMTLHPTGSFLPRRSDTPPRPNSSPPTQPTRPKQPRKRLIFPRP